MMEGEREIQRCYTANFEDREKGLKSKNTGATRS